jgi:hypothetical protein
VRLADFQFQHIGTAVVRAVHEQLGDGIACFLLSRPCREFKYFAAIERVLEENRLGSGRRRLCWRWQRCGWRSLYHRRGDRLRLSAQVRHATQRCQHGGKGRANQDT